MSDSGSTTRSRWRRVAPTAAAVVVLGAGISGYGYDQDWWQDPSGQAAGLSCGTFEFPTCDADDAQLDPAFLDSVDLPAKQGGFGGGDCTITHTPVVFVHGNADRSVGWDSDITGPVGEAPAPTDSVYDEFIDAGYNGCELFGITYLSKRQQSAPQNNYHQPAEYREILAFIDDVKEFTGSDQVDIVAHSLGVSTTLAALTWHDETKPNEASAWADVRRFVNIAGGVRGLTACQQVGPANPLASTCGSQNMLDPYTFGFYPDSAGLGRNEWTADSGNRALAAMPAHHKGTRFYTIHAGSHDQVHCGMGADQSVCGSGALFNGAANVTAQLDVGAGANPADADLDLTDGSPFTAAGGDLDGVGHFKARNNSGAIVVRMLTTDCTDLECAAGYRFGPVSAGG